MAGYMLEKLAVVAAQTEVTYGTCPTMTSSNTILVGSLSPTKETEYLERDIVMATLGRLPAVPGKKTASVSFTTELRDSGAAAVPKQGVFFEASGFVPSSDGTWWTFTPTSDPTDWKSLSMKIYRPHPEVAGISLIETISGAYGSFTATIPAGGFGQINWTFTGLWAASATGTTLTSDYESTIPPVVENATFTMGGASPGLIETIEITSNIVVSPLADVQGSGGFSGFYITDRNFVGSFNPLATAENAVSIETAISGRTAMAMIFTLGTDRVEITAPAAYYNARNFGAREGVVQFDVPVQFAISSGDDECLWKFKQV